MIEEINHVSQCCDAEAAHIVKLTNSMRDDKDLRNCFVLTKPFWGHNFRREMINICVMSTDSWYQLVYDSCQSVMVYSKNLDNGDIITDSDSDEN